MSEQNIELVKKGYEAFAAGDSETVLSLFDDNIEWIQHGDSAVSGTYHGKAEVGQYMMQLGEKGLTTTPDRFLADGDTVVVLSQVSAGGETARDADVFAVRDGKIVHAEIFGDTAMMARVFGRKEVAAG